MTGFSIATMRRTSSTLGASGPTANRVSRTVVEWFNADLMSDAIVYVDTSEVREGAVEELKSGMKELADFVAANEPRIVAYNVYFSADGSTMTVVHVHPDSASLEFHLEVAGPFFRRFADLVTLSSIQIYGEPGEDALKHAHGKARLLGSGDVEAHALHAGFTRFAVN